MRFKAIRTLLLGINGLWVQKVLKGYFIPWSSNLTGNPLPGSHLVPRYDFNGLEFLCSTILSWCDLSPAYLRFQNGVWNIFFLVFFHHIPELIHVPCKQNGLKNLCTTRLRSNTGMVRIKETVYRSDTGHQVKKQQKAPISSVSRSVLQWITHM